MPNTPPPPSDFAKRLRRDQTDAEACLWSRLRNRQLGVRFRRQHRLAGHIIDFACLESLLVVELDGGQHLQRTDADARRTQEIEALGFRVLRFWNDAVLKETEAVMEAIWVALKRSHSTPRSAAQSRPLTPALSPASGGEGVKAHRGRPAPSPPLAGERAGVRGQAPSAAAADALANCFPTASPEALKLRARLNRLIREFFHQRGVMEVETPILSQAGNTDPNIESFRLDFDGPSTAGSRQRWLRTSPEFPLKRLLAAGIGDCYELGRVFRNGEAGRRHNPEFTLLEWYRISWDHHRLMQETAELVQAALALIDRRTPVETITYRELFKRILELDPHSASLQALQQPLAGVAISPDGLQRDDWLNLLLTHCIEPALDPDTLTLVHDFPASQCALARVRAGDPPVAERFELYLGPIELANGYHELADAAEQGQRFAADLRLRGERGSVQPPMDQRLLQALEQGLPACAGVALGVDRLLMAMLGTADIADVLAFPFDRA